MDFNYNINKLKKKKNWINSLKIRLNMFSESPST